MNYTGKGFNPDFVENVLDDYKRFNKIYKYASMQSYFKLLSETVRMEYYLTDPNFSQVFCPDQKED